MKKISFVFAALVVIFLTSCDATKNITSALAEARAPIYSTENTNQQIGEALFMTQSNGKVTMKLSLNIPSKANSSVAVHFHEHGDCGMKGDNAHGHWNPTKEAHGAWGAAQFHSGDIGNITIDANGNGLKILTSDRWSLGTDAAKNIVGLGIIVHGGVDDYTTQPTGNSGPRIGCGVIVK